MGALGKMPLKMVGFETMSVVQLTSGKKMIYMFLLKINIYLNGIKLVKKKHIKTRTTHHSLITVLYKSHLKIFITAGVKKKKVS